MICKLAARDVEDFGEEAGTTCVCLEEGRSLSCADTGCQICSSDGEMCLQNFDYGYDYTEDGVDNLWRCNMQFLTGRNETLTYEEDLEFGECTVGVDGVACNSCDLQFCSDGFLGRSVDCSNIEEGAVYDDCDATLDGGKLLWFMAPEHFETECFPCLVEPHQYQMH